MPPVDADKSLTTMLRTIDGAPTTLRAWLRDGGLVAVFVRHFG